MINTSGMTGCGPCFFTDWNVSGRARLRSCLLTMPPLFLLLLLLPGGCTPEKAGPVRHAFYHWQTTLDLTGKELTYLDSLEVSRLYVRFFDVDWDEDRQTVVPLAVVQLDTAALRDFEIVPAVFVTTRSMRRLAPEGIDTLAARIFQKITDLAGAQPLREVQLDCDWTAETREAYFRLLTALRQRMGPGRVLSTTVRLHQLRYPDRTGIPPADRGMLMCYNTGDLEEWEAGNSILTVGAVEPYLHKAPSYPLPLDLALPVFRWGVLFRDGQLVRLLNELGPEHLTDTSRFVKLGANRFQVSKSTYLDGYYLYRGDRIRTEAVDEATLVETAGLLRRHLGRPGAVVWYHLDTTTIKRYPHAVLAAIHRQF